MSTDFTSIQTFEVVTSDAGHEPAFEIGLTCTAPYFPGSFDPRYGGEPPSGPEFEVTTITVAVPRVNKKTGESELEAPLQLTWAQFSALVGEEIAEDLFERACQDAADNGDF